MHAPLTQLFEQPERYGYFQALRLLLLARPRAEATDLLRTLDASVRLGTTVNTGFPASEIHSLQTDAEPATPMMRVNFMGLGGPMGVLPLHYTEWLAQRRRQRDEGPAAFLDLFNHRMLLLFWWAWARNRPAVMHELAQEQGALRRIHDLVGMGTRGLLPEPGRRTEHARSTAAQAELPPEHTLGYYSGLVSQRPRGSNALARVLGDYWKVPVTAQPCVGTWQAVPDGQRTRLGDARARLGEGAVLGQRYWDRQTTLRLRVGPLDRPGFQALLPRGGRLEHGIALARFLTGLSLDLRIQLSLRADAVTPVRLGQSADTAPAQLGWNTWLAGRRNVRPATDSEFHFHATGGLSWR